MVQTPILMCRRFPRHTHAFISHFTNTYTPVLEIKGVDIGDLIYKGRLNERFAVCRGPKVATLVVRVGDAAVVVFAEAAGWDFDEAGGSVGKPGDCHGADGFIGLPVFKPVF